LIVFLGWAAGMLVAHQRGDFKLQLVNKCKRVVTILAHTYSPMPIVPTRSLAGTRVQHSKSSYIGSRADSTT
jgi:hypothetical protein